MKVANYITLQVTVEFDQSVNPDAVRRLVRDGLEDVTMAPSWLGVRESRGLPYAESVNVQLLEG